MIYLSNNTTSASSNISQNNECLGVVLAGGLSSRMGEDKASLQRNKVSMLDYSKQLLTGSGINRIVISGEPKCSSEKDILITDKLKEAGPLGGIASVIEKYKPTALLILPVDMPLMTVETLNKLKEIGELTHKACFYSDNYLPLYLPINAHTENFLRTAFTDTAKQSIDTKTFDNLKNVKQKNGPSMRALLNQVPHKTITIKTPSHLFNTNTPEDWAIAQKRFTETSFKDQKL